MSKLYEAEIKFVAPHTVKKKDIIRGFDQGFKNIELVTDSIQDMGSCPYQDEYFFNKDNETYLRFRFRQNGSSEITSKRIMVGTDGLIRVEPELDVSVRDEHDIEALYCLMHNIGFTHNLSIKKMNVIMGDGYFTSMDGVKVPIQVSSYTATASYPTSMTGLSNSKHFFEVEINKAFLDIAANSDYADADKLLRIASELRDRTVTMFPNYRHTVMLLPSHFTEYKAQSF